MTKSVAVGAFLLSLAASAFATVAQTEISKPPFLGPYWSTLDPEGTTVYADSFLAPAHDLRPSRLGAWFLLVSGSEPHLRFEIWADNAGTPDAANVLATTGSLAPFVDFEELTYVEAPVATSVGLTPGERYWFVATRVGETGGALQTGAHAQNSIYQDNGTFAYSNDPAGVKFDVVDATPEMAFRVSFGPNVLIFSVPCKGSPSYLRAAADSLGAPITVVESDQELADELTSKPWELVLLDLYDLSLVNAEQPLIDYIHDGGRLGIAFWDLAGFPDLQAALDVTTGTELFAAQPIHRWRPTDPLFSSPTNLPDPLVPTQDFCSVDGVASQPTAFGRALAGLTEAPANSMAALVVGNRGHTVVIGEMPAAFGGDDNENGQPDGRDLAANVIENLLRTIYEDGVESSDVCAWSEAPSWGTPCATWCGDGNFDVGEECDGASACGANCRWSCQGYCGGGLPGDVCYCDDLCVGMGDCCSDACSVCGEC